MANKKTLSYSRKEMAEYANISVKKFTDNLKKVCEKYEIDILFFKNDHQNPNSDYYFPPQIAELLVILVKNDDKHPYSRRNVDVSKITASSIQEYTDAVLNDIEHTSPTIKDYVYSDIAHATSVEIDAWIEPFTRELTNFILLNVLKYGNIGQALKHYTNQLNQMNYYLYRSNFMFSGNFLTKPDVSDQEKNNAKSENVSIDNVLVSIIKSEISKINSPVIETEDLKEIINIFNHKN